MILFIQQAESLYDTNEIIKVILIMIACFALPYIVVFLMPKKRKLYKAYSLYRRGNYDEAKILFSKYLEKYPQQVSLKLCLADIELRLKNYDNSIKLSNDFINHEPDNFEGFMILASVYGALENFGLCLHYVNIALKKNPPRKHKYGMLVNKAIVVSETGDHEEALKIYREAVELIDNDHYVYNNMGYTFIKMKKYKESIPYFDISIKLNKNFAFSYNNRAFAFANIGNLDKAFEDFKTSLLLDPSNPYLYKFRGLTFYKTGKLAEAKVDLEKALHLQAKFREELLPIIEEISKKL